MDVACKVSVGTYSHLAQAEMLRVHWTVEKKNHVFGKI